MEKIIAPSSDSATPIAKDFCRTTRSNYPQIRGLSTHIDAFKDAMLKAGLTPPEHIIDDGELHRFSTNGKPKDDSGWYVLHADAVPAGKFGCWRTSVSQTWSACAGDEEFSVEIEARKQKARLIRSERDAQRRSDHQQAAQNALKLWESAKSGESHPYLDKKGVKAFGTRVHNNQLVVPLRSADEVLRSLQFIDESSAKKFLAGGRVAGCYHAFGKLGDTVVICEGYATGASIHEATGHAVAVAFNAGNLQAVAEALRTKLPDTKIIIAADDDQIGQTKGLAAAQAAGGLLALPVFPAGRPEKATDFNDMHQLSGLEAVRLGIEAAVTVHQQPNPVAARDTAAPTARQVDPEDKDHHRNAPQPSPECLYGLIGDIANAGAENTEANPYAIGANALAYLSAAVGRACYLPVGNVWHHARLFTAQVGRSSLGRKGEAASLMHRIDKALRLHQGARAPQVHRGGLSTREGLILLIHDGFTEGKKATLPVADKRLWVIESEFANVLAQSKRDGNTLSTALRDLWDGVSLRPATKTSRVFASDPHVALSVAITPSELRAKLSVGELSNGFANRFMFLWAERTQLMPFPRTTPQPVVDALAQRIREVIEFAESHRVGVNDTLCMELDAEAERRYVELYKGELNDRKYGELISGLLDRRAPTLLRIAMLLAMTDKTHTIGKRHLDAALAWTRYWSDSVRYIFSTDDGEAEQAELSVLAERITEFLRNKGQATRKSLTVDCFNRHQSKTKIDAALDELLAATPPRISVESIPRESGPGSPTKIYRLAANSANGANREDSCGFIGTPPIANSGQSSHGSPISHAAQSHANAQGSLSSLSSHPVAVDSGIDDTDGVEEF